MTEASAARRRKKKDKKDRGVSETSSLPATDAAGGELCLPVLAEACPKPGVSMPTILLSARDLRGTRFAAGDPVLVESRDGRQTVAIVEAGGREGGVLLPPSVMKSICACVGETVNLTIDFEAFDAASVEVEIPRELSDVWQDVMGGLNLDSYLSAVLDGALVMIGDVRTLSINGKPCNFVVSTCRGNPPENLANTDIEDPTDSGPWLLGKRTHIKHKLMVSHSSESESLQEQAKAGQKNRGFALVGGLRAVVDELYEAVQLPLERPDLYRQLGIGPPRGVLLYGPPGTGKTLLARSLAEELQCPVELCAATDLVGTGIGESEERIAAMFERCRKQALDKGTGALIFIDEIDAVCPKRDDSSEVERRMVAAFLTALDGTRSADGVVVLGATNRPDAIDSALRRAGRFEREIEVGVPNTEERHQILQVHLTGVQHNLSRESIQELARRCHGYVGADLRALCMAAGRVALRNGNTVIDFDCCISAARLIPPSALKELLVEVPEVRWGDIGGYEKTKEALREAVEWPIKHAWAFEAMRIEPPRGVLLYGPPGCSKTMMAKAVATETEMNFVSIKGPELFSKYVGDSEKAVRDVFRKARLAAPCVVFFDEIDAVGANREGEGGGGVAARVLAQLLAEMDGIGSAGAQRHVVVLAATNRPHILDPALTRPGRFDRLVHVPLPDEPARLEIFQKQLAKMHVHDAVDAAALAARTVGCSGAEVVMVCREAALSAIRESLGEGVSSEARLADKGAKPCACLLHFERAMISVRPRIDAETVRFYEEFEQSIKQS